MLLEKIALRFLPPSTLSGALMRLYPDRNRAVRIGRGGGFTLVEMVVVIGIILLLIGVSLPVLGALKRDAGRSSGIDAVALGAEVARAYARSSVVDVEDSATLEVTEYGGAAAIFDNAGFFRFVRVSPVVKDGSGALLIQKSPPLRGFQDLRLERGTLPSSVRVLGIAKTVTGTLATDLAEGRLIPPPFAIHFDANGHIKVGVDSNDAAHQPGIVYYDHNGDAQITAADAQPLTAGGGTATWDGGRGKHYLPTVEVPAVSGVRVFYNVRSASNSYDAGELEAAEYRDLIFSRTTGAPLRND